jgi:hypothetical protein
VSDATTETYNNTNVKATYCKTYSVYALSKARGEQEAWKWVRQQKPHFVFNKALPTLIVCEDLKRIL